MGDKISDHIVRAIAANGNIRAFAATTRDVAETARRAHDTSPVVTAALGRTLTAGAMMGAMEKGRDDLLTIQLRGNGPMKGITVSATSRDENGIVNVKGYPIVPDVMLDAKLMGQQGQQIIKLDVGGAIGAGTLSIIRDLGLKDPYIGQVELQTGEIAEDLAYYYAVSEQVPSAVGLGVLMEKNNTVKCSGGFIIQLMPEADETLIASLEKKLSALPPVTELLDAGNSPEQMLEMILDGYDIEVTDDIPVRFSCNCDKERVERVLISIGKDEIDDMIAEGKDVELKCRFCGKAYEFSVEELKEIRGGM